MSEFIINLDDQHAFQNNGALHAQVQVDVDRDANPERRGTLMPSECIMGPGKPYQVSVAFKDPSRATRWRGKDVDKSGGAIAPWVGTNIQYTIINSPNGEQDGQVTGEFIMTMVSEFNKTCSAQAFLQGVGAWNPKNPPRTNAEYINLIEQVVARNPVMGIHTDWEGQEVSETPNGDKIYTKIEGLNSWRHFPTAHGAPGSKPMPVPRIPILDKDGKETGRSYVASSRVVRREAIAPGGAMQVNGQQVNGSPFQAQAPTNGSPYAQQQPYQQPYAAPPQQYAQPQFAAGVPSQQYMVQPQPPQQYTAPQPAPYVAPQPMAHAPSVAAMQTSQGQPVQQGQAPQGGAQPWQQPGPSFR